MIVDDHLLFAEAIELTLRDMGLEVLGIETNARSALETVERERPELVFVDIGLPDTSGVVLGERILEMVPETRVVALTALSDPKVISEVLRVGFQGYFTKDTDAMRFADGVREILAGAVVVPQPLPSAVAEQRGVGTSPDAALMAGQLTDREREVMALLQR